MSSPPPPTVPQTISSSEISKGKTIPRVTAAHNSVVKILVIGDPSTGKTSLIKRYVYDLFSEQYKSTIGVDFTLKAVTVDNTTVRLQLWDIAGQEHFHALNRVYYKDAFGVLLLYDISKPETFESVVKWKREVDNKVLNRFRVIGAILIVTLPNGEPLPVVLCGNKCDLAGDIDRNFLDSFTETNGFSSWFETSAKDNKNVGEAVQCLVRYILKHHDIFEMKKKHTGAQTLLPAKENSSTTGGWSCCNSF